MPICISLPKGTSFTEMKHFLRILYSKMCYSDHLSSELLEIPPGLVSALSIDIVIASLNQSHLSASVDIQGFIPRLGRFICPFECGELFKSQFTLNVHLKNHHQPSSFMCEECGAEKESSGSLKLHQDMIHKEQQCKECSIILSGRHALKKHVDILHSQRVQCTHCTKDFMSKKYLLKIFAHSSILKHHLDYCRPRIEIESCPLCGKGFKFEYLLRRHLMTVHEGSMDGPLPQFECELCFQLFGNDALLLRHKEKIHTPDEDLSVICKQCNTKFPNIENYEDHVVVNHGERPYTCGECSVTLKTHDPPSNCICFLNTSLAHTLFATFVEKRFNSLISYRSHRLNVHSIDPKIIKIKIICHICQKQFRNEHDLHIHFKSCSSMAVTPLKRSNTDKYPCQFCGRGFMLYSQLHSHLRMRHSVKRRKHLKCHYCEQTFAHSSILHLHLKSNHTHKRLTSCNNTTCSFVSLNRRSLIEHHASKHSIGIAYNRKKIFICSICEKALSSEALRRIHMGQFHLKNDEVTRSEFNLPDVSFSLLQEIKMDMNQNKNAMKSLLQTQSIDESQVKFGQENIGELKNQMKQALKEEYDEFKSGIRPSIAYKIYPWRRYLNKVFESEVPDYRMKSSVEKSLPPFDPIAAMITVYHDPDKIHKPPLKLSEEKTPYFPLMNCNPGKMCARRGDGYALDWPLTDSRCGPSIYNKRG
ncbi:KRAB [Lepeophtheirus salmonis]|uniref:KRAB n=1 Tax=Lepeophtheirus salmonis TaxID=72036 RepID=A0A7R8CH15_LEPSM|nr:KRAB [Lepeophtheirus salmonis]CAF2781180.1 KRAB [Lepeophtheirus salmonis]